jgi:aromatic ring-cleaving dioxygenase
VASSTVYPLAGGCDCGAVRYRMETAPLFVHCCHCRWCQRETGASFALNALIEADRVTLLGLEPEIVDTPSASGKGQRIARCPKCRIALWSNYSGAGPSVRFVRVGTLDEPDRLPPDIHIFTASKQPWIVLPPGTPAVPEYYDRTQFWPAESLARRQAFGRIGGPDAAPRRPRNVSDSYHAHVYFGPATVAQARALVAEAAQLFEVQVGRVHEQCVGPHPQWSCQLAFDAAEFDRIIPWLDEHRGNLDVLVHGLTGDDVADHTVHAAWLGREWPLDLSALRPGPGQDHGRTAQSPS